ncbi:TIR domain-containing protein [Priestia sp. MF3]|uniref:TIR domain-containing protein n=1 Tax=Priestia sp. MF3 TaxID=3404779 RepID=UPI003BA2AE3A
MSNELFTIKKLKTAWMKCRNFNFKDFREFHLFSERDFYDRNIEYILEDIRLKLNKKYEFHSKYVVPFPKKNGLIRRKVFLNLQDQIVTHAILDIIGKKVEKGFYRHSYGNRLDMKQGRYGSSTFVYYVKQYNKFLNQIVYQLNNGYNYYCETDITSYFDHIRHETLLSQLKEFKRNDYLEYIYDYLVPNFLSRPFILNGEMMDNNGFGIPQGGAFSYFLSNVYLTQVDYAMSKIPNIKYLRYVDDIRIMGKCDLDVERALLLLQDLLFNLSLELNSSKTTVRKINQNVNILKFKEEQAEKLSQFNEMIIDKQAIDNLKSLRDSNEFLLKEDDDFSELLKLRERKKSFATNKLIFQSVPESFPFLKEAIEARLDKASFLLSYLKKFRHKAKDVEELNNKFSNRPYGIVHGVALRNKIAWSKEFNKQELFNSSQNGESELALINNGEINEPLLFSLIVKNVYSNIQNVNPFLVQTILYQFQKRIISERLKIKFIAKLLESEKYKELEICIYLADIFKNNKDLYNEVKLINKSWIEKFVTYLETYSLNYYYALLHKENDVVVNIHPSIEEGFVALDNYIGKRILSYREINIIMSKIIQLIIASSKYLENPHAINFYNIWIDEREQMEFKIKLNPNPVEKKLFATPEEVFNEKVDLELKSSLIIGMLWTSLYVKKPNELFNYYQPYTQFNSLKLWKNNNHLFKDIYRKKTLEGTQDYHNFIENLKIINNLTKKSPKFRISIKEIKGEGSKMHQTESIDIFFSYSHEDESYRKQLEKHLAIMKRQGIINGWSDRDINAGDEWKTSISDKLESAKVVLLLISADFLASDYCYDIEMKRALERHDSGEAKVIPIILRSCDWSGAPFSKLQALPTEAKPIDLWVNSDEAFTLVSKGIGKTIANMRE